MAPQKKTLKFPRAEKLMVNLLKEAIAKKEDGNTIIYPESKSEIKS